MEDSSPLNTEATDKRDEKQSPPKRKGILYYIKELPLILLATTWGTLSIPWACFLTYKYVRWARSDDERTYYLKRIWWNLAGGPFNNVATRPEDFPVKFNPNLMEEMKEAEEAEKVDNAEKAEQAGQADRTDTKEEA